MITGAEKNSADSRKRWMNHDELVQFLENLKIMIKNQHREERAYFDKQFFELRLHIYVAFELMRRDIARLRQRVDRLEQKGQA